MKIKGESMSESIPAFQNLGLRSILQFPLFSAYGSRKYPVRLNNYRPNLLRAMTKASKTQHLTSGLYVFVRDSFCLSSFNELHDSFVYQMHKADYKPSSADTITPYPRANPLIRTRQGFCLGSDFCYFTEFSTARIAQLENPFSLSDTEAMVTLPTATYMLSVTMLFLTAFDVDVFKRDLHTAGTNKDCKIKYTPTTLTFILGDKSFTFDKGELAFLLTRFYSLETSVNYFYGAVQ